MVRWDRARSAFDPDAWSISNIVPPPEVPAALTRGLFPVDDRPQIHGGWPSPLVWLEPNTVEVGGKIRVFARAIIDEKATANIAAVLDYDEAANELRFTQFTSWPGGQCKFFIINDQPHRMYWMLSNLVTNSQDLLGWGDRMRETKYTGGPGNERRWLFCTTASTASIGSPRAAWRAGRTPFTAASCTPAPPSTATTSSSCPAPAGTPRTSTTPTSAPSTASPTSAPSPWTSTAAGWLTSCTRRSSFVCCAEPHHRAGW